MALPETQAEYSRPFVVVEEERVVGARGGAGHLDPPPAAGAGAHVVVGDAGQAQQHVKDLFEIAKKTPFETEPIIQASLKQGI